MVAHALLGIFVMGCLVNLMESCVIRCPEQAEWNIRAEIQCQNTTKYFCLYNDIDYTYKEGCTGPDWDRPGSKRVYSRNFNRAACNDTRYQPINFVTNGNSDCIFRKSLCTEEGQILFTNGTMETDSTCRCDYKQGYAFVTVPRNKCSCRPSEEDCSCYLKKCQGIGYYLSADYECTIDITKKTDCPLMSKNSSEDPHIDVAPTETPREYDSYAIKRKCDAVIVVLFCISCMIVITMCFMFHQRLSRCLQQSTKQVITMCFMFHQRLSRYLQQCIKQAVEAHIESGRMDAGPSLDTIDQNTTNDQSAGNTESKRMETIYQNGSNHEPAGNAESKRMETVYPNGSNHGPAGNAESKRMETVYPNGSNHEPAGIAESKRMETIYQNGSSHEPSL